MGRKREVPIGRAALHHVPKVVVQQLFSVVPVVRLQGHRVNTLAPPRVGVGAFGGEGGPHFRHSLAGVSDVLERQLAGVVEIDLPWGPSPKQIPMLSKRTRQGFFRVRLRRGPLTGESAMAPPQVWPSRHRDPKSSQWHLATL